MKRSYLQLIALISLGMSVPLFVFADTWLGAPNVPPPQGNMPGVIWNTKGLINKTPQDAEINVSNRITAGSATLSQDPEINFFENIKLEDTKAFYVNKIGPANFYMGNWGNKNLPWKQDALQFHINGDVLVNPIDTTLSKPGNEGRVQAEKFCFNPGDPSDCIDAQKGWPNGGAGLYVNKLGDSMSGPLVIGLNSQIPGIVVSGGVSGGQFTGSTTGIEAISDGYGVYAHPLTPGTGTAVRGTDGATGGLFSGTAYGVQATTAITGSGKAVIGSNGAYGGDFNGTLFGVVGRGGTNGGYFTSADNFSHTQVATPLYGLFTDKSIVTQTDIRAYGNIRADGSIHAPNMTTLGACIWTVPDVAPAELVCPITNPFMTGLANVGDGATKLHCCKL